MQNWLPEEQLLNKRHPLSLQLKNARLYAHDAFNCLPNPYILSSSGQHSNNLQTQTRINLRHQQVALNLARLQQLQLLSTNQHNQQHPQ